MYGENEYKYFLDEDENEIYRVHVEQDEDAFNPRREFDGYACKIYAENREYDLSDKLNISSIEEAKRAICYDANISVGQMIDYIQSGKTDYELKYNRENEEWELWGSFDTIFEHVEYGVYESQPDISWLEDAMLEIFDLDDLEAMSNEELVVEPLIITEAYYNPLLKTDSWTHGDVDGYIWITREALEKYGYVLENGETWKQALYGDLESELKEYNRYLQGEVYGWIMEKCIDVDEAEKDGAWEEKDSCWGYIMDEDEVLKEEFESTNLVDDLDLLIKLREEKLKDIHIIVTETAKIDTVVKVTKNQFDAFKNDKKFFTENDEGDRVYDSILKALKKGDTSIHYIASNEDSENEDENLYVIRTETR